MRRALASRCPTPRTEQRQADGPFPPAGRPHSIRFFQVLLPLPASHTSNHHGAAHTLRLAYSRARRRVEPISGILTHAAARDCGAAEIQRIAENAPRWPDVNSLVQPSSTWPSSRSPCAILVWLEAH